MTTETLVNYCEHRVLNEVHDLLCVRSVKEKYWPSYLLIYFYNFLQFYGARFRL